MHLEISSDFMIEDLGQPYSKLEMAEHALSVFSRSKNPKLLFAAVRFIHSALIESMNQFLLKKKLPIPSPFGEKMRAIANFINDSLLLESIGHIDVIIQNHKKSAMVFSRKEKLMICESDYSMTLLDKKSTEDHLRKAKVFIKRISSI